MDITILKRFRHDIYEDCFTRAKDALFNTVDALMSESRAQSFPEVSQSVWFEREWSSLYEAFTDGRIDEKALREVFIRYLPIATYDDKWLWLGIDASSIKRPEAVTSPDRTAQHVHNLPKCKKPITFGWQFSTLVALPQTPSSWTYILDQQRVASDTTAIEVAYTQLARLKDFLVAIVHNHLVLARDLVEVELRPWENKQREPSPQQVRRGMHKLLARLGTPARPPQPRGKSKGRSKGTVVAKAPRFPVIRKTPKLPQVVPS